MSLTVSYNSPSPLSTSPFARRRTLGRACSPPTWACYEQISYDDDCSDDNSASDQESCSEEDDDFACSDSDNDHHVVSATVQHDDDHVDTMEMDTDVDIQDGGGSADLSDVERKVAEHQRQRDIKGKQRAVDVEPVPESPPPQPQHRRKQRPTRTRTLRPILTIHKSQGFVWNQDLFVPPYIKDRYVASTSPPNSKGFISSSVSSTNSAMTDYEVEVVEIRITPGELDGIFS